MYCVNDVTQWNTIPQGPTFKRNGFYFAISLQFEGKLRLSFFLSLKVVKVQGQVQGWAGPLGLYNSQPWVELQTGNVNNNNNSGSWKVLILPV